MIEVFDSKDLTLEICKEIKKAAKKSEACKASYVPFVRALRKKDLEECVAIINGEFRWLQEENILPIDFVCNGRAVKYYLIGSKRREYHFLNGKLHGKYTSWYINNQKFVEFTYVDGKFHGKYEEFFANGRKSNELTYENGELCK